MEEQANSNVSTSDNNGANNKVGEQQKNGSSGASAGPSSPFELRRHKSFYEKSTSSAATSSTNNASKRRASAKGSGMSKNKSSNQILNFFRSQSHEPKAAASNNLNINNNNDEQQPETKEVAVAEGVVGGGDAPLASVAPLPKPRRARPQSLYTKTTSSKVYLHRVSGIATTPETPEVPEQHLVGSTSGAGDGVPANSQGLEDDQDLMTSSSASSTNGAGPTSITEMISIIKGMESRSRSNRGGILGNGSSRSSVTSSDSFASCELGTTGTIIYRGEKVNGMDEGEEEDHPSDGGDGDSKSPEEQEERQSLKHLSVSAPAMRTGSKNSGGEGSDTGLPPQTSSKSRQKKFHRHFKTVPADEKVLDYYSCALVADILLQGFLYITENYFAFYSNVFGYVTKVLIPVCSVVRITKERTAKIFPNAVGVCTRTEKHVFASLISRDTTFKLMYKVWNYSIEHEAEEIRELQRRVAAQVEAEDAFSADIPVPDESSGDSGSGNDSAMEPSSHSPSPQNTPGIEKLVLSKSAMAAIPSHLVASAAVAGVDDKPILLGGKLSSGGDEPPISIITYRGTTHHIRTSISSASTAPGSNIHGGSATTQRMGTIPTLQRGQPQVAGGWFSRISRKFGVRGSGSSLLVLATFLLVVLFLSAAFLLSRISSLQQKLMERPMIRDSEQFYQELLSWQTKLHSTTGDEIHQYINSNLQQIVKVRESLEALSMLFVNRPHQGAPTLDEPHASGIMSGQAEHHNHHHHPHKDS